VGKCEETDENKGKTSSSYQKCRVYKTVNTIIVVLGHGQTFSLIRCYRCSRDACNDPYPGNPEHEVDCWWPATHCEKRVTTLSKWLHNQHFNIYIRESHKNSQNI
jgi:hypothetical protein